jgi:polyphenol oxidase
MKNLQSSLLGKISGIRHSFGTRLEPLSEVFQSTPMKLPTWKQVHGVAIKEVNQPGENAGEVDALYTQCPGLPVSVVTADCVPILLAKQDGSQVAAVHAGWRGTDGRILKELVQRLCEAGESLHHWVAAIGPHIRPCCYEVSEDLMQLFHKKFDLLTKPELIEPQKRKLSLSAIHLAELQSSGVREIEEIPFCTHCQKNTEQTPSFFSYRRDKTSFRQYSTVEIIASPGAK